VRRPAEVISGAGLLALLASAGCGSSGATTAPVTSIPAIPFKSAAIVGNSIPARYTCDGKNTSPPFEWGGVPSSTRELALLVTGLKPSSTQSSYSVSVEWAVAGLNPALHRLAAGRLPPGAHLGVATNGKTRYTVCPKKGKSELYQFSLYAVPAAVTIPRRFEGIQVLIQIGAQGASTPAIARGGFQAIYKRR
jgi:phosphatidylethanolamine-binding protein (PEBP) family uncharacterized protein